MKKLFILLIIFQSALLHTFCDVYLHNPRGSNNRLKEDSRERNNANRLFDSQNNNRGGYNVGNLYYYAGSKLQIEWTNQHSCGDANTRCDIILQYMCHKDLRDGFRQRIKNTIPVDNSKCDNRNCSTDFNYGMHENKDYYDNCFMRLRNNGLFVADQKLKGKTARFTRQNPAGTRYGYECPEERDHYPYWHPTPWKDIAILTDTPSRCNLFLRESENVKERWHCIVSMTRRSIPSTEHDCLGTGGNWTRKAPHGIPAPVCREPQWTRDNHLGNTKSGQSPNFNWTVPAIEDQNSLCSLRIRYNITTGDYRAWSTNASGIALTEFAEKFGFPSSNAAKNRGFEFKQNPSVKVFDDTNQKLNLRLAVNTAQFGRVFQDRSHSFSIKSTSLEGVIHNVNVRGKRGNIVQVYPAVEYDYTPNRARFTVGDYVHFQWTGSNTNNRGNDGQGLARTDRSNVLLQAAAVFNESCPKYSEPVYGHWSRSYPAAFNNGSSFLYFSKADIDSLAHLKALGDNEYLNAASTYFDLQPRKVTRAGIFRYMCSRNNNFSNRSQKGLIVVGTSYIAYPQVGNLGGKFASPDGVYSIQVPNGAFSSLENFQFEVVKRNDGLNRISEAKGTLPGGGNYASEFLIVEFSGSPQKHFLVTLKADTSRPIVVYRGNSKTMSSWVRLDTTSSSSSSVSFHSDKGGIFITRFNENSNIGLIVGMTILALVFVAATIIGLVLFFRRNPSSWMKVRTVCASSV